MALGGGTFTAQNKTLPGVYINFVSARQTNVALSERGTVAIPMELNWGDSESVIEVEASDLMYNCKNILGYSYTADEMLNIREIFRNASKLYIARLNGSGVKASCIYADAKYAGTRGNDIKIVIAANVDDPTKFNVSTLLDDISVDTQTVGAASDLVANDFVTFKTTATLTATAGTALTGGTNGTVNGEAYTDAFAALEPYAFNVMAILSDESSIKEVASAYVKRMRDEVGAKFQIVLHDVSADYEGVINADDLNAICWLAGAEAGCPVNKSITNKVYDGEKKIVSTYSQPELTRAIKAGKIVFHKVGDTVNVLEDINSLTTYTLEKTSDFSMNQCIRVLDEVAIGTANIFATTYLGKVQNNADGRVSLKSQIVSLCEELQNIGALEDFAGEDIVVEPGILKKAVAISMALTPTCAMEQLYCQVNVA